jgi:dTDP-4-dehydrorhamnose reductase
VRIVVTGREGQVVRSLLELAKDREAEVVPLGRPDLDLAGTATPIVAAIEAARPDLIVSAAAYTQVDKAEAEPELAYAVNEAGPRALARAAHKLLSRQIHLSTLFLCSGWKCSDYTLD